MDIYLIRHTEVDVQKDICYGQSDVDVLNEPLSQILEKIRCFLPEEMVTYTSPLKRCRVLAELLKGEPRWDNRLMEMHFGDWELKKWDDIDRASLDAWMNDFVNVQVPKGESFVQLHERCNDFLEYLIKQDYQQVVVITHGGIIRSWLCAVLGVPLTNAFQFVIDYGSVTKLKYSSNYWSLDFCNYKL